MPGWWSTARQAEAYNYLVSNGLSPYGAAGLVSRWANVESTANGPTSINPYSKAFGIAQWLGSRLIPIKGNTNFQAQLAYVVRELNSTESKAGSALRTARTAQEGARGASMYERAEGYNAATGIDNWTAKTSGGIPGVLAIVGGGGNIPSVITGNDPVVTPVSGDASGLVDETGITDPTTLLLLIGGGVMLWFILRS